MAIDQETWGFEQQALHRIIFGNIAAQSDGIAPHLGLGRAQAVGIGVAEGVAHHEVGMQESQPRIVVEHHPGIDGHIASLTQFGQDVARFGQGRNLGLDDAIVQARAEIDRAVFRKIDPRLRIARLEELAGLIAGGQRDLPCPQRTDARHGGVRFMKVPWIGVDGGRHLLGLVGDDVDFDLGVDHDLRAHARPRR